MPSCELISLLTADTKARDGAASVQSGEAVSPRNLAHSASDEDDGGELKGVAVTNAASDGHGEEGAEEGATEAGREMGERSG
jgi:hypothetical protein